MLYNPDHDQIPAWLNTRDNIFNTRPTSWNTSNYVMGYVDGVGLVNNLVQEILNERTPNEVVDE